MNDPLFDNQSFDITTAQGGNPDLGLEEADTLTFGLVYQPSWLEGLQFSADYYDVDLDGAIVEYREAARLDPKDPLPWNNLAWKFATGPDRIRDGKQAVELATRACELTGWMEPNFIGTLAAAYAEAGKFEDAVKWQRKALENAGYLLSRGLVGRHFLKLYEQKQPYHDPAPPSKGCSE